jgi:hypothetical protein
VSFCQMIFFWKLWNSNKNLKNRILGISLQALEKKSDLFESK